MSFKAAIKNKFIEAAALTADAKIDGREIGASILGQIKGQTNDVSKRKIARGPITNLLCEILEGLWENDKEALSLELSGRAKTLTSQASVVSPTTSKQSTNVSPGNTSTR